MNRRAVLFAAGLAGTAAIAGAALSQPHLSGPAAPSAAPPSPPTPPASMTCDAPSLRWLIGKPRTEIPPPVQPSARRVYCSTCMVTQDYVPARTDIVFDSQTGVVIQVKCG